MPRLALLDPAMTFKHAEYMAKQTPGPEAVAHRPGLSAGFCFPGLLAAKNSHCLGARRVPETCHRRLSYRRCIRWGFQIQNSRI